MDYKLGRIFWEITGDTVKFINDINKSQSQAEKFGQKLAATGKKISLFVTAPILGIGAAALKSAADMEQQRVSFETMLGSAEKATKLLDEITQFSASTPFLLPGLIEDSKRLLAFGVAADDIISVMRNLGNAAGGNQEKLDRLTLAYGKLKSKGRASLEELNMFTEAGVPILDALAKRFNVTSSEIFKMVSTGKIGFKDVNDALTDLTTGQGKFAGLIEKQSKTFSGALSTFKDNLGLAGRALVEGFLPPLTELLIKATKMLDGFTKLDDGTKKLILTLAGILAAIGPVSVVVGKTITAFSTLSKVLAFMGVNVIPKLTAALPTLLGFLAGPGGIVLAIVAAAAAIGLIIAKVASLKKEKLAKELSEVAQSAGITGKEAAGLATEFNKAYKKGGEVIDVVSDLARKYNLTKEQVIAIVSAQSDIKDGVRETLALVKLELAERKKVEFVLQEENDAYWRRKKLQEDRLKAQEEEAAKQAAILAIEQSRSTLIKDITYYSDLYNKKLITEKEFLETAQKLREDNIAAIIAEGKAAGGLSKEQQAYLNSLISLNKGVAARLDEIAKSEEDTTNAKKNQAEQLEKNKALLEEFASIQLSASDREIAAIEKQAEGYLKAGADAVAVEEWRAGEVARIRAEAAANDEKIRADFQAALSGGTEKEIAELEERVRSYRKAGVDEIELEQWKQSELDRIQSEQHEKEKARQFEKAQWVLTQFNSALTLATQLNSALSMFDAADEARDQARYDAAVARINQELEQQIAAGVEAGLIEERVLTYEEQLRADAAAKIKAEQAKLDAEKKKRALADFKRSQALNFAKTVMDMATAIVGFLANPGGPYGIALSIGAGIVGAAQAAAILSTPPPALAEGGIVLPAPGGEIVRVAEAGNAEAILPLNETGRGFIQDALAPSTSQQGSVSVPVIFQIPGFKEIVTGIINVALKSGEVIVDARQTTNLEAAIRGER